MAMVDEHGRLFGRFNLVDAVLAVFLLGLVPLSYGAYTLFRTPLPRLTAIEPASLVNAPNLTVRIRGENLRPYLRVSFGVYQGASFIFRNATEADVALNAMPPGDYDVILYDFAQERSRLPLALTIKPSPLSDSQALVVGSFTGLAGEVADKIAANMPIDGFGTVVSVGPRLSDATRVYAGPVVEIPVNARLRVPAVVRVACTLRAPQGTPQCVLGDVVVQQTSMLLFKTPLGTLSFQVDQLRGDQPLEKVTAVVRVSGPKTLVDQIRKGDVDRGLFNNQLAAGGTVVALSPQVVLGPGTVQSDVTISLDAHRGASGWTYAAALLRAGGQLPFKTTRYEVSGVVMQLTPEWSPPAP